MSETLNALRQADRNKLALLASVFPGAGHFLKGYRTLGVSIMIGGNLFMVFVAAWLALATLGISLIVIPIVWFAFIAASAFFIPDLTGHTPPPITFEEREIERQEAREIREGRKPPG